MAVRVADEVSYPWDSGDDLPWGKEDIPRNDILFYRAHRGRMRRIQDRFTLQPAVFFETPDDQGKLGMSTNWCKYSSAQKLKDQARKPAENAILSLKVDDILTLHAQGLNPWRLQIDHTPDTEGDKKNRAHTDVRGISVSETEIRVKLYNIAKIEIELPS